MSKTKTYIAVFIDKSILFEAGCTKRVRFLSSHKCGSEENRADAHKAIADSIGFYVPDSWIFSIRLATR